MKSTLESSDRDLFIPTAADVLECVALRVQTRGRRSTYPLALALIPVQGGSRADRRAVYVFYCCVVAAIAAVVALLLLRHFCCLLIACQILNRTVAKSLNLAAVDGDPAPDLACSICNFLVGISSNSAIQRPPMPRMAAPRSPLSVGGLVTRSVTLPRPRCLRLRPRFRPPGSGGSPWLEVGEGAVFTAASEI